MKLLLAPMEGLLDYVLRDILTRVGGVDLCVAEFIRITNQLLPERVFAKQVPELLNASRTLAGVPVRVQLLGSDPNCLAENAARVAGMGAVGVDLNFGCPARVVNRHGGGAVLLNEPETLLAIVTAVRRAVPAQLPVTAKMRLGDADDAKALDCARALQSGGASEIVVHARTRAQGYRPPAYWQRIADIAAVVDVPVIANGEIWTVQDALRCQAESGCQSLMLGRGAVADPGLAWAIRAALNHPLPASNPQDVSWASLQPLIWAFWQLVVQRLEPRARAGRLKQWLNLLRRRYPQAEQAYQEVKGETSTAWVSAWLLAQGQADLTRRSP